MKMLAVHPNYELYGSDRAFAAALGAVRDELPEFEVTVLVPQTGPLLGLPEFRDIKVNVQDFWIARRRDLRPARLPAFFAAGTLQLARAWRRMRRYDLVYIDTIVCLDHILAARFSGVPTLIHVHEIPLGTEMKVFRRMLIGSGATIAFNSVATRDAFRLPSSTQQTIVYNGTPVPTLSEPPAYDGTRRLRLLQIGRINFWKGQEVLIAAIASLPAALRARVDLRILGGVFEGQYAVRDRLIHQIQAAGLENSVRIDPFVDTPDEAYREADVIVVPSTRPEPFGRVAIEAMAHARAVIASRHGGLVESVADGSTGRLFAPGDSSALAEIITGYITSPTNVARHGAAGYKRFIEMFTDVASDQQLIAALRLAGGGAASR